MTPILKNDVCAKLSADPKITFAIGINRTETNVA